MSFLQDEKSILLQIAFVVDVSQYLLDSLPDRRPTDSHSLSINEIISDKFVVPIF